MKPRVGVRRHANRLFAHWCQKCGWAWQSDTPEPFRCPACGRRTWNDGQVDMLPEWIGGAPAQAYVRCACCRWIKNKAVVCYQLPDGRLICPPKLWDEQHERYAKEAA